MSRGVVLKTYKEGDKDKDLGPGVYVPENMPAAQKLVFGRMVELSAKNPDEVEDDEKPMTKTIASRLFLDQARQVEFLAMTMQLSVSELVRQALAIFLADAYPAIGMEIDEYGRLVYVNHEDPALIGTVVPLEKLLEEGL